LSEVGRNARLWSRVEAELEYIEKRLAEPNITPKTQIVLAIMRSRLNHILGDCEYDIPYKLSFTNLEKEAEKLE